MLTEAQRRELLGLALLALSLFVLLSLVPVALLGEAAGRFPSGNLMGAVGRVLERGGVRLLGVGVFLLPLLPALGAVVAFGWVEPGKALRWGILATGVGMLLPIAFALPVARLPASVLADPLAPAATAPAAGLIGPFAAEPLAGLLGVVGAGLVLLFLFLALSVATLGFNPAGPVARGGWSATVRMGRAVRGGAARAAAWTRGRVGAARSRPAPPNPWAEPEEPAPVDVAPELAGETSSEKTKGRRKRKKKEPAAETGIMGAGPVGERPGPDLLTPQPPRDASLSERELDRLGEVLLDTLRTFRVEGEIGGRTTGPVVTQYEVVPAPGIKVSKIANLDADLALALKAPSVRIVAPIPGKGAVGVEVPNPRPETVYLRGILESAAFSRSHGQLPLALGQDLTGRPYVVDLVKMPHLLIAGATGSGKSVCINTLITSLVYRHSPETLRLLMVDPKMVELSMYGDLPHLRHPVVTDPKDAAFVLKWAVLEMERRYELLAENGARSIVEFNRRLTQGQPLRRVEPDGPEGDPDRWIYKDGPLPYVVVVVDELADLMMTVQAEIEKPLAQLAQKARAIGIHLVVATQRPSVNVITGLIKANFPCRIAFRVSSKVDSRTILDQNGADSLLGNGDMLFLPPGQSDPMRIQGAFLPTEDTERLMSWYRDGGPLKPHREEDIVELAKAAEAEEAVEELNEAMMEERDPLFRAAAEVCIQYQQGSTSLLQRRLRVGYGRAARIVDQLHVAGVLGPPDGSKPREVLVGLESLENICREDALAAGSDDSGDG